MFRVRHYDQFIHPDQFKGKGALGLVIRTLNWFRWKLETYIQKLVVIALAREAAVPKPRIRELLRSFAIDVKAEAVEKEATSPLYPGTHRVQEEMPRATRYAQPERNKALAENVADETAKAPLRPQSLEQLVGMYAVRGRHQRYIGNRQRVVDVDTFEPLTDLFNPKIEHVETDEETSR